jgi:hypothetical protein
VASIVGSAWTRVATLTVPAATVSASFLEICSMCRCVYHQLAFPLLIANDVDFADERIPVP